MLYWSLMLLFLAPSIGLLILAFVPADLRKILSVRFYQFGDVPVGAMAIRLRRLLAVARGFRLVGVTGVNWQRSAVNLALCGVSMVAVVASVGVYHVYFDRSELPDIEGFVRFEFPTIGTVYDANGEPLIEMAKEHRKISQYEEIPPIVRDAIIATEDKHFFSHSGFDYWAIPRVLSKIRLRTIVARLVGFGQHDEAAGPTLMPQGGSTITQQLVRGLFLKNLTAIEKGNQLVYAGALPSALSYAVGTRSVNMLIRKLEEMRLSLWLEEEMTKRLGSKRAAKEEILARYASFIYTGNGQYGFATAAEFYFGRSLDSFTVADADKAALLAGIAKSPRDYAPSAKDTARVLRRRNQTLALMMANGFISRNVLNTAKHQPIQLSESGKNKTLPAAAVLGTILQELRERDANLTVEKLMSGQIQVYSTVNVRVQQLANEALERGLARYEQRHPDAKGLIQGSVVVLRNRDAAILAETGGRQFYHDRLALYSDFNRVTKAMRQPGSTMKPMVYLAAFRQGNFNLETMVPDEPIGVPDGATQDTKWIANYDGKFRGMIPLREALAESRNTTAVWLAGQIGISNVLGTTRSVGVKSRLRPYATTALGASEMNLLELANAYRAMASGIVTEPHVIRKIVRDSGEGAADNETERPTTEVNDPALSLIQEGLRGVVRMPTGTAHALDSSAFPIPVMGKTGTTNEFRDALFVGSTYGPEGITVAVRVGFDDNRSLGPQETGGRLALPVFKDLVLNVYRENLVGPVPTFPPRMEQNINDYIAGGAIATRDP